MKQNWTKIWHSLSPLRAMRKSGLISLIYAGQCPLPLCMNAAFRWKIMCSGCGLSCSNAFDCLQYVHACVVTSASHGEQWVVLCFVSRLASLVVGFVARRSIVAQHSKVEYHTHCVMVTHWWDVSGRLASLILTLTHTQSHNLLCSYKHCCL